MARTDRTSGHSLVELLVAMGLLAILAAGLLRLLAAFGATRARLEATLAVQRSLRLAAEMLTDDLQEAGFRVPCRAGDPLPALALARDQRIPACRDPALAGGPARDPPPRLGEVLTVVKDEVLPGALALASDLPPTEPGQAFLEMPLRAERAVRLQAGDLLVVEDGGWEAARLEAALELRPAGIGSARVAGLGEGRVFDRAHARGAPVRAVRPARSVRYGLVLLGPGPAGAVRPALARLEAGGEDLQGPLRLPRGGPRKLVEGIAGFRVELPEAAGGVIRVHLEARACGPAGCLHRSLRLVRRPRNRLGPAP